MNQSIFHPTLLAVALAAIPWAVQAQQAPAAKHAQVAAVLSPIVVTAPGIAEPLVVKTDAKAPRQPLPAHDGADFLKSIPGFSVIRKGGTDGDPVLRGFSGSRLGILLDGQEIYGGCGGRMDPPTAYVYPDSYDTVRVLKGPQTVRYGAGQSAGVVLFERDFKRFTQFDWRANGSLTFGRFGRDDQVADMTVGSPEFYVRAGGTRAHAGDYSDGDGREIHSYYKRWNTYAAVGWTPDDNTRLELSGAISDGKAAYADRAMDGSKFRRENVALLFEKKNVTPLVEKIEARLYRNYVDHVMDNYSLRPNANTRMSYAAMNPDRTTTGGRASVTLAPSANWSLVLGADIKRDDHRTRSAMMKGSAQEATDFYRGLDREYDVRFRQMGVFGEGTYTLADDRRLIGGLRLDRHEALDKRAMAFSAANPTLDQKDKRTLTSGFLRYEADHDWGYTYAGIGHAERFPDYWERLKKDEVTDQSVFLSVKPEKTTQLDIGASYRDGPLAVSVSAFYADVRDYILINWDRGQTRNINATVMGGEIDGSYQLASNWQATASLAYVFGKNRTDGKALAQQPPLELRLGLNYERDDYSIGALWRLVAAQNRYDEGSGNIVSNGKDIGPTGGFGVLSLNAGWKVRKGVLLTAGIDNVLNKTYAEHLSRTGQSAGMSGMDLFPPNMRINEPGRTFWAKVQVAF